ncbi:MAG: hypothetical protein WC841_00935 [Candidatus Shapirobacteria bacterium]|jgi:hypothetical protein
MKVHNSLKRLFVSQTRLKLLNIFFCSPKEIFYVRQLVRLSEEEINSVRRELENLKSAGIVLFEWRGNRLFYWANPNCPLYLDLLVIASKNSGLGRNLSERSPKSGSIKLLLYSYKFISREEKKPDDIDLIVIGDISIREIEEHIKAVESEHHQEINYMVMSKAEFQMRKQKRDPFLIDFFLNCPAVIIGSPQDVINT